MLDHSHRASRLVAVMSWCTTRASDEKIKEADRVREDVRRFIADGGHITRVQTGSGKSPIKSPYNFDRKYGRATE